MIKALKITGMDYDETFEVTEDNSMEQRVALTVEIHNRDNPEDLWTVEVIEEES